TAPGRQGHDQGLDLTRQHDGNAVAGMQACLGEDRGAPTTQIIELAVGPDPCTAVGVDDREGGAFGLGSRPPRADLVGTVEAPTRILRERGKGVLPHLRSGGRGLHRWTVRPRLGEVLWIAHEQAPPLLSPRRSTRLMEAPRHYGSALHQDFKVFDRSVQPNAQIRSSPRLSWI